jgi:hypothetical protein
MKEYYDRLNNPITEDEYKIKISDDQYRIIKDWEGRDGTRILTRWLGIPSGYGNGPFIFETVYTSPKQDMEIYHYTAENTALIHHSYLVSIEENITKERLLGMDTNDRNRWKGII